MKIRNVALSLLVMFAMVGLSPVCGRAAEQDRSSKKALYREGARLWPAYCSQCHVARPGGEYSPAEWDTVMMHMRFRANLSGEQTRAIVQFLKGH